MKTQFSKTQLFALVTVRVLIGWHFLYEGMSKVLNSNWTSLPYLMDSQGLFAKMFHSMAANPTMLSTVDFLNQWGLVLIGLGLILGAFTRIATIGGIVLLLFYIMSHPSFITAKYALPSEGSYLWVDKNVIELFVLVLLLVFPTGRYIGLDHMFCNKQCEEGK